MRSALDTVNSALRSSLEPTTVLDALRAAAPLTPLLTLLRRDTARLTALARNSYRHRNGFDKIVLSSPVGSELKLVLHFWPSRGLGQADNIHDHRWDFASVVLCGALCLELYEPDPVGSSYSVMRYRREPGVGAYALQPSGTTTVSPKASVTLFQGSTYSWDAHLLHRAWAVPGQPTATLIVQGPPTRARTTVLATAQELDQLTAGPQRSHRLRADEVDKTLATLVSHNIDSTWALNGHRSYEQGT